MRNFFIFVLSLNLLAFSLSAYAAPTIAERFGDRQELSYTVFFNGGRSGKVSWKYLGREKIDGKEIDVLRIDSDTKIMGFFDLTSHEKIYLDAEGSLPVKVERDLLVFGGKEIITEKYNQTDGTVEIVKTTGGKKTQTQILKPDKPVRHIMALLYFFPSVELLKVKEALNFNLPTCKVKVRLNSIRTLDIGGKKYKTYFLEGTGGKRFNLWIDKDKNYPLRIDFLFPLGKVSIIESDN